MRMWAYTIMRIPQSRRSWLKWVAAAIALAALIALSRTLEVRAFLSAVLDWIGRMEGWAPVLFIALYVLATILFFPGTVLTLGAGILFGVLQGTIYVSIGSTLGATCAFLIGRHLARDPIARRIEKHERFVAIDRAVAGEGWKIILLTRLSPVFPFTFLNYAYGLTRIPTWQYVWASWAGMLPATVMYVYIGSLAKVGLAERYRSRGEWILYGVGLLATVAVTLYVTRLATHALSRRTNSTVGRAPEKDVAGGKKQTR